MTVSSTTARWEYTGDGSTTDFTYNNLIFEDADLDVYVDGTLQELNTDYTVTNAGEVAGGEVQFVSAPANGSEVTIVRDVANTQESDYPVDGALSSETLEADLDRRTIISQDIESRISRAVKYPVSEQGSGIDLPSASDRAGKFFKFDADGNPIAVDISPSADTDILTGTDAGSANAYVVTTSENVSTLTNGQILVFLPDNAPTGASTLKVDGTNALDFLRPDGSAMVANAFSLNQFLFCVYDATAEAWILLNTESISDLVRTYTKQQAFGLQTLTDGATIDWNLNTEQVAEVTLGGNRTLNNPTNIVNGASYLLYVRQDGTGSRTLSYGANYDFGSSGAPTLTTTAGSGDLIGFVAIGGKMVFAGIKRGFTA